jgi:ferredoxin-like protein FixX
MISINRFKQKGERMKKQLKSMLVISLVIMIAISACGTVSNPEVEAIPTVEVEEAAPAVEATAAPTEEAMPEIVMADSLDIYVALGNNQRTLTYQQATPLELPDGTVISQGALKPTWQYISEQLGIEFKYVAIQDQSSGEMIDVAQLRALIVRISMVVATLGTIS